jgi:hypothetical protein
VRAQDQRQGLRNGACARASRLAVRDRGERAEEEADDVLALRGVVARPRAALAGRERGLERRDERRALVLGLAAREEGDELADLCAAAAGSERARAGRAAADGLGRRTCPRRTRRRSRLRSSRRARERAGPGERQNLEVDAATRNVTTNVIYDITLGL